MPFKPLLIFSVCINFCCNNPVASSAAKIKQHATVNPYKTIAAIPLPDGYSRMAADSNSFAAWLRKQALKENKTVYLFNGVEKNNQQAQFAVLDIAVGNKDLQQCADAIMRLRANYLFDEKQFSKIIFTDNENGVYAFNKPYTKENLNIFMERVFGMCGSASLAKQLKSKNDFAAIEAGDVLIRGGFPGHAVIVTDVAKDSSGKKIFMLAQSYMPAQDIHVLKNPADEILPPWYKVNGAEKIITPEYVFKKTELKQW